MLDHGEVVREDIISFFEGDDFKPYFADGFDYALLGVTDGPQDPRIVYDYMMCVDVLKTRDGMSYEEAVEFMEYNVTSVNVGKGTPLFLMRDSGLVTIKPAKTKKIRRPLSTDQLELQLTPDP